MDFEVTIFSIEDLNNYRNTFLNDVINGNLVASDFAKFLYENSNFEKTNIDNNFRELKLDYIYSSTPINELMSLDNSVIGIRPVLKFENPNYFESIARKAVKINGIPCVNYGTYPQTKCELEPNYDYYNIIKNKIDLSHFDGDYTNITTSIKENEIDDEYFCITNNNINTYFKFDDITWYVDFQNNILISNSILISGIKWELDQGKEYQQTNIYKYLNRVFEREIKQVIANDLEGEIITEQDIEYYRKGQKSPFKNEYTSNYYSNNKTENINRIISDINYYINYYTGTTNIKDTVTELINKYNNELKEINNNSLSFKGTEETLFINLCRELNKIKMDLQINYDKSIEYYRMLDIINSCINILLNGERLNNIQNSLIDDIEKIYLEILPFYNEKQNTKKNELLSMLYNERKYILKVLDNMSKLNNVEIKYSKVDDFEISFRNKLHPFLININNDANKGILVEDIINQYKEIINNNDYKLSHGLYDEYINEIKRLIEYIRLNGNNNEINRINIDIDFNKEDDLNKTITKLLTAIRELYKIKLDIDERKTKEDKINNYTIDMDNIDIKDNIKSNK